MARHQPNTDVTQTIVTIYRDEEGNEIHRAQYRKKVRRQPNGSLVVETSAENFALSSGEITNPNEAANRPVAVCAFCGTTPSIWPWRRRPTTRLCSVEHLKYCSDCGIPVCPRHRRRSAKDSRWRCTRCYKKHWWACLFSPLFLKEIEG